MNKAHEAIIVGGGIVGCAIAFELSKRGMTDLLLIERGSLGCGATGRFGGVVRRQWSSRLNTMLAVESKTIFNHLEEYTGYKHSCGLRQYGSLVLACTPEEEEALCRSLELQLELGVDSSAMDLPHDLRALVPCIETAGLTGAVWCAQDGYIDPFHCTAAYAQGAKRLGADFLTSTTVYQLAATGGKITGVSTDKGDFAAPLVINAAGAWAASLSAQVAESLPVLSERRQTLISEPSPSLAASGPLPLIFSVHRKFYAQQLPCGVVRLGAGLAGPVGYNINPTWDFMEKCAAIATQTLPALRDLRIIRQEAGLYDISPDGLPVIEFSAQTQGLLTVCGFSGQSFPLAPRAAALIAGAIAGEEDSLDIQQFASCRFRNQSQLSETFIV